MQDVLLYLLSMQSGLGNAVASSFKGQSPSGGWKRELSSVPLSSAKPEGQLCLELCLVGIRRLGDSSAFEGAGEVHKI